MELTRIETVYDFIMIEEDEIRNRVLQMDNNDPRLSTIAEFVNKYPNIDITSYSIDGDLISGEPSTVVVTIDREVDDEEERVDTSVSCSFYPFEKTENCKYCILFNLVIFAGSY